jgi:hypothetical protein
MSSRRRFTFDAKHIGHLRSAVASAKPSGSVSASTSPTASAASSSSEHLISAVEYYGQKDEQGRPHGMGVRLSLNGDAIGEQCGLWEAGKLVKKRWVWRGNIPPDAHPLQHGTHSST